MSKIYSKLKKTKEATSSAARGSDHKINDEMKNRFINRMRRSANQTHAKEKTKHSKAKLTTYAELVLFFLSIFVFVGTYLFLT